MPLQNYQYDTIMREYNRRQARNRRIQEEHLAEAYEKIPRLREIDEEVATLSARKARALISRQEVGIEDLRNDIALLSQERTALLLSSGYHADYLEMSYTGYWLYRQPEMLLFQEGRDRTSVYTVKFKRNS